MDEPRPADLPQEGGRLVRVAARPDSLRAIREHVRTLAAQAGAPAEWTADLVLAVDEACQNIIRHGYGCAGLDASLADRCVIVVEVAAVPAAGPPEALVVRLTDFAQPVDEAKIAARDLEDVRPGGLGVHFIRSLTDECAWVAPPVGAGNVLRLLKRLPDAVATGEGEEP